MSLQMISEEAFYSVVTSVRRKLEYTFLSTGKFFFSALKWMKAQWALRVITGKQNVSQLARQRSIITFNFKGTETEKIVRLSYVTPLSAGLKNNFLSKVYSSKFNIWHGKKTKITPVRMDRLRSVSISSQFKARAARRKINILFMKVSLREKVSSGAFSGLSVRTVTPCFSYA